MSLNHIDQKLVQELDKHVSDPELRKMPSYMTNLRILSYTHMSQAEHHIIGSGAIPVENPWIPYSVLSGKYTVDEVSSIRSRERFMTNVGSIMNLPDAIEVNMRFGNVDSITKEVDYPTVERAYGYIGEEFKELDISDAKYVGPFLKK